MSAPGGMRLGLLQEPPRHPFFTGKGGVGKTSLACATAIALSASNLDEMLGVPLGDDPRPVPSVPNLAAMNIDPEAAVERDPQLGLFGFTRRIRHDQAGQGGRAPLLPPGARPGELNNLIEQDHRRIKRRTRPMLGFKRFVTARRTLAGVEALAMLAKGQVRAAPANDVPAQRAFVHRLFGLAA